MPKMRRNFSITLMLVIGLAVSGCLLSQEHLAPESARFPIADHKWLKDGGLILENDRKSGWVFHAQDSKALTVHPIDFEKRKTDAPFTMELYRNTSKGNGYLIAVRKASKSYAYLGVNIRSVSNSAASQIEFTTFEKADEEFSSWEQILRKFANPGTTVESTELHIEPISVANRESYLSWPKEDSFGEKLSREQKNDSPK